MPKSRPSRRVSLSLSTPRCSRSYLPFTAVLRTDGYHVTPDSFALRGNIRSTQRRNSTTSSFRGFSPQATSFLYEIMALFYRLTAKWHMSGRFNFTGTSSMSQVLWYAQSSHFRLCDNPVSLSLEDLSTKFKVITVPVTLVCAGNRRKEQNVVQKSLGFSWGAGGISTALFTGVWLADVIELIRPKRSAKHVIFEGGDSLPNGPYGTR